MDARGIGSASGPVPEVVTVRTRTRLAVPASRPAVRLGPCRGVCRGLCLGLCLALAACASPREPPPPTLEERLAAGVDARLGRASMADVKAVLVLVDGRIVLERYVGSRPEDHRNVASVTKSVVSTLVGIAVGEGLLRVDQTLAELLPEHAAGMTPDVARTTLHHLLTMTGGFRDPAGPDPAGEPLPDDPVAATLRNGTSPPGRQFLYTDEGAHLVATILARATGRTVLDYAREKLFDPLGIDTRPAAEPLAVPESIPAYEAAGFAWPVDSGGVHLGGGFLKLRPRDMARLGSVYLDEGRWGGRQVVPAEWVREATRAQVDVSGPVAAADEYGYLWWVTTAGDEPAYFALGFGGQLVEVVPGRDLVVVVSTAYDIVDPRVRLDDRTLPRMVEDVVLPELAAEADGG